MTPEISIVVHDVEILITLAGEDLLDLLICKPRSKFYLNVIFLSNLDFLTFSKLRQFILNNFDQVEMAGEEVSMPKEKDGLINDLLTAHQALLARDGNDFSSPRTIAGEYEVIVLCIDIYGAANCIAQGEYSQYLNIQIHRQPEIMTLFSFKKLLVSEGLLCIPILHKLELVENNHAPEELNSEHELAYESPADDCVLQLYGEADLDEMLSKLSLQPSDTKNIIKRNLDQMQRLGPSRTFAPAPRIEALDYLQERFPNFSEVISAIARRIALARLAKYPIAQSPPILLLGEPGVGKTAFAKALAETFKTHFFEIRMNSLTAGFIIGGHDLSWSNGRPGILFNEVGLGSVINPIGLLDEIDKVSPELRYDPLGHLYTLLESDTAKRFQDEAIPLKIDLSHITWIATANDITAIEPPLLSRFTVFEIPAPTPSQARVIVRNIYVALLEQESWGMHFSRTISDDAIDVMANVPPREARKLLLDALGNAASKNRKELLASDINRPRNNSGRVQPLGFY